ncbi:SRPBCC family protein [Taibaiella koreensis]|uniref:SRPBCC family protein n=1 Tax=Taibaiella koreensis TaxID=1268548 RepID=UPI000E59D91E|nr:SRPBCC family protein [Taibaiella koreensis]
MACILMYTLIHATPEQCFDLSRDTEVHLLSTRHTHERVVAGRSRGLFEAGDTVTWEAVHLGIRQQLETRISRFDRPHFFEDVMVKGAFRSMRHEHHFREEGDGTIMTDIFDYTLPAGPLGQLFDWLYLKGYMMRLLEKRNRMIKAIAEKDRLR